MCCTNFPLFLSCSFSFFFFYMLLYPTFLTFGIICIAIKHISTQNAFMYKNMYTHKWVFVCTYEYTYVPRKNKLENCWVHVAMHFFVYIYIYIYFIIIFCFWCTLPCIYIYIYFHFFLRRQFFEKYRLNLGIYTNLGNTLINSGVPMNPRKKTNLTWFEVFSKQSEKNWDFWFLKSQLGESDLVWNFSKQLGKGWDLRFFKSQLGEFDPIWNFSKQSGKGWDLGFFKSQLGESDPV